METIIINLTDIDRKKIVELGKYLEENCWKYNFQELKGDKQKNGN